MPNDHERVITALRRVAPQALYLDDRTALEALANAIESDDTHAQLSEAIEATRRERDEAREQRDQADQRAELAERKLLDAERAIDGQREELATLQAQLDEANKRIPELAPQS